MYDHPPKIPPSGESLGFNTDTVRASEVDEYFFRLVSMQVGSLAVNGYNIVSVQGVERNEGDKLVRVLCESSDGLKHEVIYPTDADTPVLHHVLDSPSGHGAID